MRFFDKRIYVKFTSSVTLTNPSTGAVDYYTNIASDTQVNTSMTMGEVRGGVGNPIVAILPSDTNVTVDFTTPDFNLKMRAMQAGGKYGFSTAGKIVIIEGVGNSSKYVSKSLDTLLEKGFFKGAVAVVFGHFSRPVDKEQIDIVLEKFAGKLDIPVYRGFPFGHQADNLVIDFFRPAFIKNNVITFPEVKQK